MKQKQNMMNDKKGFLGLEDVRNVILFLLVLGVITIGIFLALDSVIKNNTQLNTKTLSYNTFTNKTINLNTSAAGTPSTVVGLRNVVLSSVIVTNATSGVTVTATNYTISAGTFIATATASYNNSNVNVSATYAYDIDGDAVAIQNNITGGTTNFFKNIPIVFTLLGAVVLVSIIVLIVFAANRISEYGGRIGQ